MTKPDSVWGRRQWTASSNRPCHRLQYPTHRQKQKKEEISSPHVNCALNAARHVQPALAGPKPSFKDHYGTDFLEAQAAFCADLNMSIIDGADAIFLCVPSDRRKTPSPSHLHCRRSPACS